MMPARSVRVFSLCFLALSCILALGAAARPFTGGPVGSLPCRSEKGCTNGPVFVSFATSDSCQPAEASSISAFFNKGPNWPAGKCNTDLFDESFIWNVAADRKSFTYRQWYQKTCDGPAVREEFRAFGLCVNTTFVGNTPSSYMILASAQESIPTSGDLNAHPVALPTVDERSRKKCPEDAPNCGYAWMTSYSDSKCTQKGSSFSMPLHTTNNQPIQLNGCYTYENWRGSITNNVAYRCANGKISTVTYQGAGCDSTVLTVSSHDVNACIFTGYSYVKYFC